MENDPFARLRMFPGSVADQVIALTDLWKSRSKRTFVAMRERMNELEDLELEPAAFDNYFRRSNRATTPEDVVWALIRVMRDDSWLPREQQCTLAEALYLAALKNVSVVTYARINQLFPGQEEEFKALCPLGDLITEKAHEIQPESAQAQSMNNVLDHKDDEGEADVVRAGEDVATGERVSFHRMQPLRRWGALLIRLILLAIGLGLVIWTVLSLVGVAQP